MKRCNYIKLILCAIILFEGCSVGKKALHEGDYYKATLEAVHRLRKNPDSKKAKDVLVKAYGLAKENGLRKIRNAMDGGMPGKYMTAADEYIVLKELADAIYECPKALEIIENPSTYDKELGNILPVAAEEAYGSGLRRLQLNTMEDARKAYYDFLRADGYVKGYRNVEDKIREALYMATLKVVVERPSIPRRFQLSADFFYDNIMSGISQMHENRFVRFYTYEEAVNDRLEYPDQYLVFEFDDFSVGDLREFKRSFEVCRDSVFVGTTVIEGITHKVYGEVKAEMTVFSREVASRGLFSVKIVDARNNRIRAHRKFPAQFVWHNEWATYKGDERALDEEQKKIVGTESVLPPSPQVLFGEMTKPIFSQVLRFLWSYYSEY